MTEPVVPKAQRPDGPDAEEAARLAAIRARVEKATAGPWKSRVNGQKPYKHVQFDRGPEYRALYTTSPLEAFDADFIAHAREDIPYLLALVQRLRKPE